MRRNNYVAIFSKIVCIAVNSPTIVFFILAYLPTSLQLVTAEDVTPTSIDKFEIESFMEAFTTTQDIGEWVNSTADEIGVCPNCEFIQKQKKTKTLVYDEDKAAPISPQVDSGVAK